MRFLSDRDTSSLPAIHGLHLADLVARWDVPAEELLRGTGLSRTVLSQPQSRLSVAAMERLIERARALTGEPALGIYFGLQMRVSWHGYLGLAAMTAQNVRQAIDLVTRFVPTRTDALALSLDSEGPMVSLILRELADFGAARDAVILALLVGIWQLACTLTGRELRGVAEVAMPEPAYIARMASVIPQTVRFGQVENRLLFDASVLDLPMMAADPAALVLTREQCERELDALGLVGPLRERVRALALRGSGGTRSLGEVADHLGISSRTLKRRLAELHTSYSELLDQERKHRAVTFLRTTSLAMEEIAERLGYSDTPNFFRAFRRWTGRTPGSFRRAASRHPHGTSSRKLGR